MTATFTVRAGDIADALANVLPHADANGSLPILASVRFEVAADGLVTLVATDRYTLALVEVVSDPAGEIVPGEFLLHRGDVADVIKMAKAAKLGALTFTAAADNVTVTAPGISTVRQLVGGDFPKYRSLLPEGDPVQVGVIGLGSQQMAKFAKLQDNGRTVKNASLVCTFRGATKPVDVRVGEVDDFRAIVMPVRLPEAGK